MNRWGSDQSETIALVALGAAVTADTNRKLAGIGTADEIVAFAASTKTARRQFAPGIPRRGVMRDIPSVEDARWKFVLHDHHAERAGRHTDLRLSDGVHAYSWATRKPLPQPGDAPILLKRQSDHTHEYTSFAGVIREGYGKGRVRIAESGTAHIRKAEPGEIHFGLTHRRNPQTFMAMQRPGSREDWWLINTTPTKATRPHIPDYKPRFRDGKPEDVHDHMSPKWVMRAKVDGGHTLLHFKGNRLELFSYRRPADGKGLIDHTYLTALKKGAKALDGSVFRAETYVVDKHGRHLPNRLVSGIMNMAPEKARKKMKAEGWSVRVALLSPHRIKIGGRWVIGDQMPYREKRKHLERALSHIDGDTFFMPHEEQSPAGKRKMLDAIRSGKHPESDEGVVIESHDSYEIPKKVLFKKPHQVYVREIHQGAGAHRGMAGAYSYSLTPKGAIVGRVGFGSLSHDERREVWDQRDDHIGRKAIVFSRQQHPSGALRAPTHSHWHV